MSTKITRQILEAYLNCKTKAHLKLAGQQGNVSDYEALLMSTRQTAQQQAVAKILARNPEGEVTRDIPLTTANLRAGSSFILNATLDDDLFSLSFDGLKRVDGPSKLGDFQYVPMLFHEARNVGKQQRLLLELYGLLLSRLQGQMPSSGIIWHGKGCRTTRVRLNGDLRKTERLLREAKDILNLPSSPRLMLNDHCEVCEFRQRCHDQAVQEDDISLLRGISEKEIKSYARKDIFSVAQLAHTFRPRRKSKNHVQTTHKRHRALQALAIRDKKIYIFGTPELKISPVRIYLDMEGNPDEDYVYLIGMIVAQGDSETTYSFWADDKEQEGHIFEEFLSEINKYEDFVVFCYGAYEGDFLKRMREQVKRKTLVDRVLKALVNILSPIYSHIYFPTYSNGLKEIGGCLGGSWTEPGASGIQSVVWRKTWEITRDEEWKRRLTTYNLEDCSSLRIVTQLVSAIVTKHNPSVQTEAQGVLHPPVLNVQEIGVSPHDRIWGNINFIHPDYKYINDCAYFDYQRERVYVRTSKMLKKTMRERTKASSRKLRVTKHIKIVSSRCPACGSNKITTGIEKNEIGCQKPKAKRAYELVLTTGSISRRVIECRTMIHQCEKCQHAYVPEAYERLDKHYHGLKSWAMYQHVGHRLSFDTIEHLFKEFFGLRVYKNEIYMFKSFMARYYQTTYRSLLKKILAGQLLHIDETEVKLRVGKGYIWVFTNLEEVVYIYRPTREGDFLRKLLKDFHGVLVSDFYAAYDSIECPQQKCLIHLMRDINQELLNNPYDEELLSITRPFGAVLRAVVETVDTHGLKKRFMQKHKQEVESFFKRLNGQVFCSEAAESLRSRLMKHREKLFSFIGYDGVPWNNNNAENAIRQFVYYREGTSRRLKEQGLSDYLVLLSLYQTCRYKGVSFLKFLVSGQREVQSFCEGKRSVRRLAAVQVYPKGFVPPHLANWRKARVRQQPASEALKIQ